MTSETFETVSRLTRDMVQAAATLSDDEARYLVDTYYQIQDIRIINGNRAFALENTEEPNLLTGWLSGNFEMLEGQIKRSMKRYAEASPLGEWALSICGIGPVFAGGLIAFIDPAKFETNGNLYSYCGLVPGQKAKKGEKINWNPRLRKMCWLIGESFVKVSGNENDFYGKLYRQKKEYYQKKNADGGFADRAKNELEAKKWDKSTVTYKALSEGRLSDGHINSMAKRYAVKMFISHFWEVGRKQKGLPCPDHFAIAHLNHAHVIKPPNFSHKAYE